MRNKIISVAEAVDMIPDGATIMYGGFLGCGSAHHIIEALAQKGTKDLTIIGNDCGMATGPNGEEFYGVAKLVHNHQVKHVIATHVGMTPDVGTQGMVDKTLTVDSPGHSGGDDPRRRRRPGRRAHPHRCGHHRGGLPLLLGQADH